jgi:hypothetical protein
MNATVLVCALLIAPVVAHADEATDHLDKGTRYYNVQDWPNALTEYKAAYVLDPRPETLWAIAQTQRQAGDCRAAILTYKAYLRGASTAGANAADQWIKQCEANIEAQRKAAEEATKPVEPPQVHAPAQPVTPVAAHPTGPAEHRSALLDPLGDVLGVIALAGVGAGGWYLVRGNSDMTASSAKPTYQLYDKAVDDARTEQHIGAYALIGGTVFAGLAVWRFLAVRSRSETPPAVAVTPLAGGLAIGYGGSF